MERYVFISYSTQNTEIAFRIKEYLEHKGYPVWIAPTDIPVGERYCNVIEKSIRNCRCFVLLITPSILRSQWIDKEIERAIHYRKPVLGVVLEPAELNDELRFLLSNTQISDCVRSIDDGDPALQSVLRSLAFLFEEGERQAKPLAVDEFSAVRSERNMGKAQLIATAKGLIEGFLASPQRAVEVLSRLHFKEVNTYLRLLWEEVSAEEKRTIERNLIAAYRRVRLDPDVTGRREYAVKGQLIYYLTRFCAPTAEGELTDTLKAFYEGEDNVWQRQSLAYGLASAGEFEVPCDYAQKVFAGRDEDERMFTARAPGKADGGFRPDDGKGKGAAHLLHARRSRRVARKDGGVNAQRPENLQPLPHIGGDLLFRPAPVGSMRFVRKIKIPHAVRKAQALEEDPEAARAAVEYADARSLRHALPPRKNPRKNVRIPAKTVYNQCILC